MFHRESGDPDPQHGQAQRAAEGAGLGFAGPGEPHEEARGGQTQAAGNRPAQNARQVQSASQIGAEWRGGENATDFLGLDQELIGSTESFGGFAPAVEEIAPFEVAAAPTSAAAPAPATFVPKPPSRAPDRRRAAEVDAADAPADIEADVETEVADALSYAEPHTKGRLGGYLVRALAAAAVLAVVATLYKLYSTQGQDPVGPTPAIEPTADQARRSPELSLPGRETATGGQATAGDSAETAALPRGRPAPDSLPTDATTVETVEQAIRDSVGNESVSADVDGSVPGTSGGPSPEALDPTGAAIGTRDPFESVALDAPGGAVAESGAGTASGPAAKHTPLVRIGDLPEPGVPGGALRYATPEDLANLWEGETIPLELVGSATRIVTPNVGRVRAVLDTGELFEGRMYAVGRGKIWLETELGRMALEGDYVKKVEHILVPEGAAALGARGSEKYAGLPRVRARAPGGVFFGRLIDSEEGRVTLITEEGARITLEGADVEPAPTTRRIVVKGYQDDAAGD